MMKKILAAALGMAMASISHAANVSGDVKFAVTVPDILVLYHWDTATLTLSGGSTSESNTSSTGSGVLTSNGTYNVTTNPITAAGGNADYGTAKVTLQNAWGVRSIATNDPLLTLTTPGATLTRNGGSETIALSNAKLECTTATDCTGSDTAKTIDKGWAVKTGSIVFDMDLSDITASGTYSSGGNTSKTFTLEFATQ